MINTFKIHIITAIDKDMVWNTLTNPSFVKDFLPEVQRNLMGLNLYTLSKHKNGLDVMPAYVIKHKTIHWINNLNITIELAKTDLNIDINHIEINLDTKNNRSIVSIEVQYNSPLDLNYLKGHKVIKSLFSRKLMVLKQDLEKIKQAELDLEPNFGYPVF
jgi:hypothetical protein